tara:strand:- start:934 stop:1185 length:252 start_codon:yes stop_codon:yes gene_type:complete
MISFAKIYIRWFNTTVKKTGSSVKDKIVSKYFETTTVKYQPKRSDINVLLNRIKVNKKSESRKKLYFSAAASTGILLFGLIIF